MKYETAAQRRNVYEAAYNMLLCEIDKGECTFICANLFLLIDVKFNTRNIPGLFPEFYAQKPENIDLSDNWWEHNANGNQCRIEALQRAIAACDIQIKNTAP